MALAYQALTITRRVEWTVWQYLQASLWSFVLRSTNVCAPQHVFWRTCAMLSIIVSSFLLNPHVLVRIASQWQCSFAMFCTDKQSSFTTHFNKIRYGFGAFSFRNVRSRSLSAAALKSLSLSLVCDSALRAPETQLSILERLILWITWADNLLEKKSLWTRIKRQWKKKQKKKHRTKRIRVNGGEFYQSLDI